jgi:hypothetical protein
VANEPKVENAPPVVALPTTGAEPGSIPPAAAPSEPGKPKRKYTPRKPKVPPAGEQPTGGPSPEALAALQSTIAMFARTVSGILVAWRGEAYRLVEAQPEKRHDNGTVTPAMPAQADALGAAWSIPLAPLLLDGESPWALALVTTVAIFGPMVLTDLILHQQQAKRPADPPAGGPALVKET